MKAAVLDASGPPEAIHVEEVSTPHVSHDHVVIALDYASVGIWDALQRSGKWGRVKPGTILGADGAGTIAAIGDGVEGFGLGDRVYSYSYGSTHGFYAQYVNVPAERVAHVPRQISQATAGAMPCVALTALSGLDALGVKRGQTLLVYGASGGVGSLAVWLGNHGIRANVVGTARRDAQDYVRELGASIALDPRAPDPQLAIKRAAPKGFDEALVTANGDNLVEFLEHVAPGHPFAYPNGVEPEPTVKGHKGIAFDGAMSRDAFDRLNDAIGSDTLPLRLEVYGLNDVVRAHQRIEQGHVVGKLVLQLA